ncbi:phage capsid protein [Loigolactobacillus coryniformis]|uniref:phage capsid protein n=1 Tax=Loigolactobacillus TaxID=2767889 RepID=UPI000F73F590|nr:phage capsid protein [Loigolactobacillus zhaoyuanensis]
MDNAVLLKQMAAIQKAGNNVTLRDDNARAFVLDQIANATTLAKLPTYFANSGTGSIDKLGVKRRTLKLHQGTNTKPDGTDIAEEGTVPFALTPLYLDTWIENSNTFYTARTRGQDVRQALLSLMQSQYAADLQDLAFNGDAASTDAFLKLNDGFIKQAKTSNAINNLEVDKLPTIAELTLWTGGIKSKYLRAGTYTWFMSQATSLYYVNELQGRQTALGDATIVNGKLTNIGGYAVEVVDNMDDSAILFTTLSNLVPVVGLNVTLTTAAADSLSVAKQATYHFMLEDVDFIIREPKMLGIITKKAVTPAA